MNLDQPKAENIDQLCEAYQKIHQVVLYTGSGVSTCSDRKYGIPTWVSLLKEISGLSESAGQGETDPFKLVETAIAHCGSIEGFFKELRRIIENRNNYTKQNGLLSRPFLNNAYTLNAVAAFCGELEGQVVFPDGKDMDNIYFQARPNPRVHAVLTSNYDCFLEAGAATLFRKPPLKPLTAMGSQAGDVNRIPVFHIHGYIPHPFYNRKREPVISDLIIREKDYIKYWNEKDVFGTTMGPQIHFLRYYTVIFIGFSFNDNYVYRLLRRINKDYLSKNKKRKHFAFVDQNLYKSHNDSFFDEMGIVPVIYKEHEDLPYHLGQVYRAGLQYDPKRPKNNIIRKVALNRLRSGKRDSFGKPVYYPVDVVWDILRDCRLESVRKSRYKKIFAEHKFRKVPAL